MIIKSNLSFNGSLSDLNYASLNGIVFHHMAHESWGVEDVHRFHRDSNGWAGIGYNYFIDFEGRIYEGRGMKQGAHARGHNATKVGVGFQGHFDRQKMTDAQVESGNKLVKWINDEVGRSLPLYGHKDVGVTACPGKNFRMSEMTGKPRPQREVTDLILRRGSKGQNVKQLQNDLLSLGYELPRFGADGDYGRETEAAVKQLQRDHNLTVDGIAGPQTLGKIENLKQADEYLYRVQVGAFSNEGNALAMEQRLKDAGFETYIVKQ